MAASPLYQVVSVIGEEIARMWWFFLLSVVLVGVIKGYRLDLRIRSSLSRTGLLGIVLAVAVGMVSPVITSYSIHYTKLYDFQFFYFTDKFW